MTRLRGHPARYPTGLRPFSLRLPLKADETFRYGAFVLYTPGTGVSECGTNPAVILGLSAQDAAEVVEAGYVIVWVADDNTEFVLQGVNGGAGNAPVTPTEAHIGVEHGVSLVDGVWCLDTNKTGENARVFITGIAENREWFYVKVLAANRQHAA